MSYPIACYKRHSRGTHLEA